MTGTNIACRRIRRSIILKVISAGNAVCVVLSVCVLYVSRAVSVICVFSVIRIFRAVRTVSKNVAHNVRTGNLYLAPRARSR